MQIESGGVPGELLAEYAAIPIAFEVRSVVSAERGEGQKFVLTERPVTAPYTKDYDAISERPDAWSAQFDTSLWRMWLVRVGGRSVGGATVAVGGSGELLEGRRDLAVLWDIRVAPGFRGRGVGRAMFVRSSG